MRTLLRVSLKQYRAAALWCALTTGLVGLGVSALVPPRWVVEAEIAVREPTTIHRLANPFVTPPRQGEGLKELPQEMTSREQLVALVKRTGLLDQWESSRPAALRLKDRLMTAVRGPIAEKDRLEALVAMLDQKINVTVQRDTVYLSMDWPSPRVAYGVIAGLVDTLRQQRETREVRVLDTAARTLEDQREGVRAEISERVANMQLERSRAALEHRAAANDAEQEQLRRDQLRIAELTVRAEEKEIGAEVMRRSNALRFIVVRPPLLPREPEGPGPVGWALMVLVVALLSGVASAVAVAIAAGALTSQAEVTRELGLPVLGQARLPRPPRRAPLPRRAKLVAAGLAIATGVTLGISRGSVGLAVAPIVVLAAAWQLWVRPLKYPLLLVMLSAVVVDDPTDRPYYGMWRSPLFGVGKLLFSNVAWFTGLELCVMGLFGLMFVRRVVLSGRRPLDPVQRPVPRVLWLSLVISAGTLVWLIALGIARGGVFREALWQFRAPLIMPMVCILATYAFEFPKDLKAVATVLAIGTVCKTMLGAFFIFAVATPQGLEPPHTTGHNDTMIFVTATVFCLCLVWEAPSWPNIFRAAGLVAFAGLAMVLNDRRIAYVDIAMAVAFIYLLSPWHPMKRAVTRLALMMMPVVALYMAAGWNSRSGKLFKPVQKVRSIIAPPQDTEEESSNVERDIENFNITKSWEANMFIGQGFGHAFHEFIPSNDFSQSRFGHIGHNSILWLLWIGGVFGFTGVMMYLAMTAFLIARTLREARVPHQRIALLVALSIVLTYLNQAFGDMGMLAMQFDFFVATAVAITGQFASRYEVLKVPEVLVPSLA